MPSVARHAAPPPALTVLLLIVAAGVCVGVVLAATLALRLQAVRADVAVARQACPCCDEAPR